MKLRAKFRVHAKTQHETGWEVDMAPVTGGSKENDEFFYYTPSGSLKMSLLTDETASALKVGKVYYIDFSPADK